MTDDGVPLVALVVLNWNGADDTVECLASVRDLAYPNVLTIVVDNGSSDDSVERVRSAYPVCTLIQNPRNVGFAEGNNIGIRHALAAEAGYVMLLNNDTVIERDAVSLLVEIARDQPSIGILGPAVYCWDPPDRLWFAGGVVDWRTGNATHLDRLPEDSDIARDTDFVTGCGLMVRAEVLKDVGLLDPRYFFYYEDADLCFRARAAGWRSVVVPRARMRHKVSSAMGSVRSWHYSVRNRYLFASKQLRGRRKLAFLGGYLAANVQQYRYFQGTGKGEEARALLDGLWAAIRGRYGEERSASPAWLRWLLMSKAVDGVAMAWSSARGARRPPAQPGLDQPARGGG